jgi:hypothetical protein
VVRRILIYVTLGICLSVFVTWALVKQEGYIRSSAMSVVEKLVDREAELRREGMEAMHRLVDIVYSRLRDDIRDLRNRIRGDIR